MSMENRKEIIELKSLDININNYIISVCNK